MKKKTKLGLNTGNSLGFGFYANYMKRHQKDQHVIIKTMDHPLIQPVNAEMLNNRIVQEVADMVQDGDINDGITYEPKFRGNFFRRREDIVYSANKRKRWEIKDKVLKTIEELREHQSHSSEGSIKDKEEPFNISLSERKFIPEQQYYSFAKMASCTEYHSSATKIESAYPNRKFSYVRNLRRKCKDKPQIDKRAENRKIRMMRHNQHFRALQRKNRRFLERLNWPQWPHGRDDDEDSAIPEIHYEICGSRPMMPHAKYFCHHQDQWGYYSEYKSHKAWKKVKHNKNKAAYLHTGYGHKELKDLRFANSDGVVENRLYGDVECNDVGEELNEESELVVDTEVKTNYLDFSTAFDKYDYDRNNNLMVKKNKPNRKRKKVSVSQPKCGIPNVASSNDVKQHGKGTAIFEDVTSPLHVEVSEPVNDNGAENLQRFIEDKVPLIKEKTIYPVTVQAETHSLNPKDLESYFEDAYIEGCSKARSFIVNLSHYYLKKNSLVETGGVHSKGGIYRDKAVMYAVFKCYGPSCIQVDNDDEEEHYDYVTRFQYVSVNIEGNLEVEEKMGIHQRLIGKFQSILTIKDVVDITIETLMPKYQHFFQDRKVDVKNKASHLYRHFNTHNKWDATFYTTEEAFHVISDLPAHSRKVLKPLDLQDSMSIVENTVFQESQLCEICYTTTDPNRYGNVRGTALMACHHWFCNDCWIEHLHEGIKNGVKLLECPAYDCDSAVDHVTLMFLLGYRLYEKHWLHIQNGKLEDYPDFKWCPSTVCNRTAKVKVLDSDPNDQLVCVHCDCGLPWCFDCQKEPHWPIPCKVADRYVKVLKQRDPYYKDSDKIVYVEVKKCKKCRHPMEKNGGCQQMSCRCGFSFCWECLQSWQSHGDSLTCPTGYVGLSAVHLEDDISSVMTKEQFYDKALEFRKKRQMLIKNSNIEGRLFTIIQSYLRTTHSTNRKQFLKDLYQQFFPRSAEYAKNKETLKELYNYLYQVYHFLEYCFAFFSQVKIKRQGVTVRYLGTLCLVTSRLEHVIRTKKILSMADLVHEYQSLHNSTHTVMQKITRKLLKYNQTSLA